MARTHKTRGLWHAFTILCALCTAILSATHATAHNPRDIEQLIAHLAQQGFERAYIETLFADTRYKKTKISPSPICKKMNEDIKVNGSESLYALRNKKSVALGQQYYRTHKKVFDAVNNEYGVAPEYLLGLLRIETYFGECIGEYRTLSQLIHIYAHPRKSEDRAFARDEITALLTIAKKNNADPYDYRGSSRGAIGLTQFLPTSVLRFAIDADNDERIDMFDPSDAIPSTANFLVVNHWRLSRTNALWNYNHDWNFVRMILAYAHEIKPPLQQ